MSVLVTSNSVKHSGNYLRKVSDSIITTWLPSNQQSHALQRAARTCDASAPKVLTLGYFIY